jgi:hypothetical protein
MPVKPEPPISSKVLSSLFARFTADRDALFAAVERCEQRLVDLSERLDAFAAQAGGDTAETKAEHALAVAEEALALAHEAIRAELQRRG